MMKKLSKSLLSHTFALSGSRQHLHCPRMFWYKTSYALKFPAFSQFIFSKTLKLRSSIFVSKCCKFYLDAGIGMKLCWMDFGFWNRFLWIGCPNFHYFVENSGHWHAILLDTVLRFEIWLKGVSFIMIEVRMMKTLSKTFLWHTCALFRRRQHVDYPRMFWYKTAYAIKFPRFSQSITSKTLKLRGSIFVSKCCKFHVDFRIRIKLCWKDLRFWDRCLWIDCAIFRYFDENSGHWEEILLDTVLRFEI